MRQKEAALAFCPGVPSCAISIKGQCTGLAELTTCEHQWVSRTHGLCSQSRQCLGTTEAWRASGYRDPWGWVGLIKGSCRQVSTEEVAGGLGRGLL